MGDVISSVTSGNKNLDTLNPTSLQGFVADTNNSKIDLTVSRGKEKIAKEITPVTGLVGDRKAIGIGMDMIGILKLNPIFALWEGGKTTVSLVEQTVAGLGKFLYQAVTGKANFSEVSGPVGIVGMVGDVSMLGFIYLLQFTAFISINLAVINLIPFPALDGGRLLFVLIEKIKGSAIKPAVANVLNSVGFALLLILMAVVTYHDIAKLVFSR